MLRATLPKKIMTPLALRVMFSNLEIEQSEIDSLNIVREALNVGISNARDPMSDSIFSQAYFDELKKVRQFQNSPVLETNRILREQSQSYHNSARDPVAQPNRVETVLGIGDQPIFRMNDSPTLSDVNSFRFPDRKDFYISNPESDAFEAVYNLREDEMYAGRNSHYFDRQTYGDDHFSKELESYTPDDFVADLKPNQIIISNIGNFMKVSYIIRHIVSISNLKVSKVIEVKDIQDHSAYYKIEFLDATARQIKKLKQRFGENSNNLKYLRLFTKSQWSQESYDNRTIVISNIPAHESSEELIAKLSKFSHILAVEIPKKYSNPHYPTTQQVMAGIQQHYNDSEARTGLDFIIRERKGEDVREIKLSNEDLSVNSAKNLKRDYFEYTSIVNNKIDYNLDSRREVFFDADKDNNQTVEFKERLVFNSIKESNEQENYMSTEQVQAAIEQVDPLNPSILRTRTGSSIGANSKKMYDGAQLAVEGESNLGYMFVTFSSSFEAKKAMYLLNCNFDLMSQKPESQYFFDLKNGTDHMDWDKEYKKTITKAIYTRKIMESELFQKTLKEADLEQQLAQSRDHLQKLISEDFYAATEGMYKQKTDFTLNSELDPVKIAQTVKRDRIRRKLEIRNKIKALHKIEAKNKYLSKINAPEPTFERGKRYEPYSFGRNNSSIPSPEYSSDFMNRVVRSSQVRTSNISGLRVDPEYSSLLDSLKSYSQEEIDDELRIIVRDFAEDSSKANMIQQLASYSQTVRDRVSLSQQGLEDNMKIDDEIYGLRHAASLKSQTDRTRTITLKRMFNSEWTSPAQSAGLLSYQAIKNRFFQRVSMELEGNIEDLGRFDTLKDHLKASIQKKIEYKDFIHVRDRNGELFFSEKSLNVIKNDLKFRLDPITQNL